MNKYVLSGLVLLSFAGYAMYTRVGTADQLVTRVINRIQTGDGEDRVAVIAQTPVPTSVPSTGKYKDGSYTGIVADAIYGNIQVQVIITSGKITDVIFLQYPNDRQTSIEINTQAMPYLKQEAITAQSANVNGVTGATASSDAFVQSLSSALKQAT